jgi:phage terminase large subunit
MDIEVAIPDKMYGLFEPHRYKIYHGGRGSAKSWSAAQVLIVKSLEQKLRIGCFREVQKSIRDSVHRLLNDQIQRLGLGKFFDVTRDSIKCIPTGSEFLFAGLANNTVESIKSFEGIDIAWIEEAQTVSENSWQILIPTIRADNSEIWITMNPELETDPTYVRFVLGAKDLPDAICEKINFYDNPWFPEVLQIEMETLKANDMEAYDHVWLGNCKKHGDAVIFKGKYVSYNFEPDKEMWSPFYGADWGFANDPTAFTKSWVYERTLYIEHEVCEVGMEIDMTPANLDLIPGSRDHIIRADNARPETISYMKRSGFKRMIACKKWPGSVEDGVDYLRSFDKIVVHPRCTHTLEEFKLYSYRVDARSGDIMPDILDKHNHCIDAIRYSLEPMILGYKQKVAARKAEPMRDSLGRVTQPVSMARLTNPNLWIS